MKQLCGKLETSLSIYAWRTAQDHDLISMRIKCLENKIIPLLLEWNGLNESGNTTQPFLYIKKSCWRALTTITWKNKNIAAWYLRLIQYQCSSAQSQPVIMMTTKLLFLLVLLAVRNFLRQYCEDKLNFSWKSDRNALCKVCYVNIITRFLFLLTSERLVAYRLINRDLQIRLRLRVRVRVFQCVPGAHARLWGCHVNSFCRQNLVAVLTPTTRFSTNLVPRLRVHYRCKGELKG